ncbi:MAG: YgaP-like transmembrane domain [Dehalococcoidia bacterium]
MFLESGRALVQGILVMVCAAIAYWVSLPIGLALVAIMGLVIVQSAFTDWCPSHLLLRPLGLKKKGETKPS